MDKKPGAKLGIAIYPGTFDPLTNGHTGIVHRGAELFKTVIVAVAADTSKKTLFSLDERVDLTRQSFADTPNVLVEPFEGLTVEFARKKNASVLLRGLRAVSDFEYEFQLALMNRKLCPDVETVFLMTDFSWMYISSTIIKSVASLGGDVSTLVPAPVQQALERVYGGLGNMHSPL